ncbi:MAG: glycosyltransferase family 39 protein [Candidatus Omnitrophica bacterium]|nr:glycosyltransferase family 39 protein [Candidatus Omnitrophota bacterium]MBU1808975.1 glycosyltransferase family 39 protein [Candidatus Omnitrophota bacterium]
MAHRDRVADTAAGGLIVLLYSFLSIAYFIFSDKGWYIKNIFGCGFAFTVPVPYIALVVLFILTYSRVTKQKVSAIAYPAIAMAVILPLLLLLVDMKIGICGANPFARARFIYGEYAKVYFLFFISLLSIGSGLLGRLCVAKKEARWTIFHLPVFVYLAYIITELAMNGLGAYALTAFVLFCMAFSFETVTGLARQALALGARITKNEKLLIISLFALAFFLRSAWGLRLIGLTGEKFIMASDDGPCYTQFASILANGGIIPKTDVFAVSGFAYWYFLAFIYKIFGVQNFKAMVLIQSAIGALVPVFSYFIARKVFRSRFIAVLASVIMCVDMTLVFLSAVIGMEAIYIPLVVLALLVAVYCLDPEKIDIKRSLLTGCAFGLAYNARAPELLLFPFVLAVIIYFFMRNRMRIRKIVNCLAALFAGFLILASAQYVFNYAIYGEKPRMQSAATASFSIGIADGAHSDENKILGDMGFNPFGDLRRSVSALLHNPVTVMKLIGVGSLKRLTMLYCIPNFGNFDPLYVVNPGSGYFFRFSVWVQCVGYILVAIGIIAALVKKETRFGAVLLFSFLAYMSIRVALFFVLNARYRGVLLPVFMIFFACGVGHFRTRLKAYYARRGD